MKLWILSIFTAVHLPWAEQCSIYVYDDCHDDFVNKHPQIGLTNLTSPDFLEKIDTVCRDFAEVVSCLEEQNQDDCDPQAPTEYLCREESLKVLRKYGENSINLNSVRAAVNACAEMTLGRDQYDTLEDVCTFFQTQKDCYFSAYEKYCDCEALEWIASYLEVLFPTEELGCTLNIITVTCASTPAESDVAGKASTSDRARPLSVLCLMIFSVLVGGSTGRPWIK